MVERLIDRLMRAIGVLLGAGFVAGVLLNLVNVAGRYGFGRSILGADEAQIFIMVWAAFLGAAVVTWRGEHLRMDILLQRAPAWWQRLSGRVEWAILALLSGFVVVQSSRFILDMLAVDRRSEALGFPIALAHAAVLCGFVLIGIVALLRLLNPAAGADRTGEPS